MSVLPGALARRADGYNCGSRRFLLLVPAAALAILAQTALEWSADRLVLPLLTDAAYLHERDGNRVLAARLYAQAARSAPNLPERDHLTRQAARLNAQLRG